MKFLSALLEKFANKQKQTGTVEISKSIDENKNAINLNGLVVYAPKNLTELNKAILCVKDGQAVIINFANMKKSELQRIFDYLSGAFFATNAQMMCLQDLLYVVTPNGTKLSTIKWNIWKVLAKCGIILLWKILSSFWKRIGGNIWLFLLLLLLIW